MIRITESKANSKIPVAPHMSAVIKISKWCSLLGATGATILLFYFSRQHPSATSIVPPPRELRAPRSLDEDKTATAAAVVAEERQLPFERGSSFALKMHWQRGYMWQENPNERKWCMVCRKGCRPGHKLRLTDCDRGTRPTKFTIRSAFPWGGSFVQLQVAGTNLCVQAYPYSDEVSLNRCSPWNRDQWFVGDFDQNKFEIKPFLELNQCLTQEHHPKSGEEVLIRYCDVAREDQTSYWVNY